MSLAVRSDRLANNTRKSDWDSGKRQRRMQKAWLRGKEWGVGREIPLPPPLPQVTSSMGVMPFLATCHACELLYCMIFCFC